MLITIIYNYSSGEYNEYFAVSMSAGFSLDKNGALSPSFEGSVETEDFRASIYLDNNVIEGLKAMQEMITSDDNPASKEDKNYLIVSCLLYN